MQEVLLLGQEHLNAYLSYFIKYKHWHMFPAVVHFTTHIWEDCIRFGCAGGYLSAYPFENQLAVFSKVRDNFVDNFSTIHILEQQFIILD